MEGTAARTGSLDPFISPQIGQKFLAFRFFSCFRIVSSVERYNAKNRAECSV